MKYDLKKIILKKDIKNLFHELFAAYDNQITIVDASYEYIFGSETVLFPENKMSLKKDSSDIVGYVYGPSEFNKCCMLIQHLIKNEYEKKELADDSIERYRELNLFYSISNNFSSVADIKDIALALLEKISKVISVSGGAIVLYDNETNETNIIADIGVSQKNLLISEIMTFFKKEIFVNGNPFLMNQINELSELSEIIKKHIHSLILIPMKQKNKITGTMFLWNNGVDYLSNDLKNATAVAAQASFVFENIKLYDELRETFSETVKTLMTTLEKVGNEHAGHSENVSRLSLMIAEKMSLPKKCHYRKKTYYILSLRLFYMILAKLGS
ncbi:MAG: GAF domain-containing protein [Candidatus Wallbacteria bacterium]